MKAPAADKRLATVTVSPSESLPGRAFEPAARTGPYEPIIGPGFLIVYCKFGGGGGGGVSPQLCSNQSF